MYSLENSVLKIAVKVRGAELCSLTDRRTGIEYIWQADPQIWPRHSPLLFPVVGRLKEDRYLYRGKSYSLPQHGFARDADFRFEGQEQDRLVFSLSPDEGTLASYPFDFKLYVEYRLEEDRLTVACRVRNPGVEELFFSIGGHPAFNVPLGGRGTYEDHYLEFSLPENISRRTVRDGLIADHTEQLLSGERKLPLKKELFYEDALVLQGLRSEMVSLRSEKHAHGLDFVFEGFPYLGIWARKDADFVCLEPWHGIADSVHAGGSLPAKEGIRRLAPGEEFLCSYSMKVY